MAIGSAIIVATKYLSILTTAFFTALGLLREYRKDGKVTPAGRVAVVGAVISAVLAFATESFTRQREAEQTSTRLDFQNRQLAAQKQLLDGQAKTLNDLQRSNFAFDTIDVSITAAFPAEQLRLDKKWTNYGESIPQQRHGEISAFFADGGQTVVERALHTITACPGSRLYPALDTLAGQYLSEPFEIVVYRPDRSLESFPTPRPFLYMETVQHVADLYYRLIPKLKKGWQDECLTYFQDRRLGQFEFTAGFQDVAPQWESGHVTSVLDMPRLNLLVLTQYRRYSGIQVQTVALSLKGKSYSGGRATSLGYSKLQQICVGNRLGALHTFSNDDFGVTVNTALQQLP